MKSMRSPSSLLKLLIFPLLGRTSEAAGINDAARALNGLMTNYDSSSGLWDLRDNQAGWWQSAVALQATLDFMVATGTHDYIQLANYTIDTQRAPLEEWPQGGGDFRAASTDDTGWWALALLSMYSMTGEKWLLDIAITDEAYLSQYWTTECSGGLIWRIRDLSYKAAISNELYIELTATLHNLIPGDEAYLAKSLLAWEWFRDSGMINNAFLINDGLMGGPDSTCVNNNAPTWTYNQGVVLGALVQLHTATGDADFLDTARKIANAVIASSYLAPEGILTEPCLECTDSDPHTFKGVFMRYLTKLNAQLSDRPYTQFILSNAASMFSNGRLSNEYDNGVDLYGMRWQGPFDTTSVGSQESAVMLLTAALGTRND
ncbi:putative Mannan endo-1,6-alpha-mannosidase [Seiridium cardinale]